MQITTGKFYKKYGIATSAKIPNCRLAYITRFGYTKDILLNEEDLIDLEYLDSTECLLTETAARIDDALLREPMQKVIDAPFTISNIDQAEDVLFPIMDLHTRMLLHLDFAEVRLRPFFKKRTIYCIHKWAEHLLELCALYRQQYSESKKALESFIAEQLANV